MAARYGDARENGGAANEPPQYSDDPYLLYQRANKRRSTRLYGQTAAVAAAAAAAAAAARNASSSLHPPVTFREFTRESLAEIEKRRSSRAKRHSEAHFDPSKPQPEPDPCLASGQQLPPALVRQLPPELVGKPIEDIDPFYSDQETFVIISRGKELTRFSAKKALCLLGPFHPIRRIVLHILVSSIFNLFVILTILTNCILMTIQGSETVENTEIIFTIIYTTEMSLKVLARGFIMDEFTYLRDPWNWLDFMVIIMAYLTIVIKDLGNLSVMRTFRVLRALKTVAIIPGMKTIVGAVIDSVKNLKDVVVLTLFSLSVFSLLGLQIYMGILTQKCIKNGPDNMNDSQWFSWCNESSHWIPDLESEIFGSYRLCGNASGAQSCPPGYTCLQGFGQNPDYGFTNFDTFGWALICSFRLMTQDFWEGLYMQILKTAGSWHILFFIVSIFLGSIYLMNLILAIVAMSYNELQRRAEEEEEAAAEDEAAFLESCRLMELQDQMSNQFGDGDDRSTPEPGATSYRPSVEIGLVGQSLLASLCQNGLLGQQVREKLERQFVMPGYGNNNNGGGGGRGGASNRAGNHPNANRSHSLSVNLDYRRHSRPSQHWLPPNQPLGLAPQAGGSAARLPSGTSAQLQHQQQLAAAGYFFDPLMLAASMTELRRKSSVRTSDSYSPTNSQTGSLLGQRRLLPNIGVTGNRLDRHSIRLRRHKLSPHLATGSLMMLMGGGGGAGNQQKTAQADSQAPGSSGARGAPTRKLQRARSSTASDRDLQVLKQKAAMIRINETLGRRPPGSLDNSDERCNSDHLLSADPNSYAYVLERNQAINKRSSIQLNPLYYQSRRLSARNASLSGSSQTTTNNASANASNPEPSSPTTAAARRAGACAANPLSCSEAAICEQPSRAQPFGRLLVLQHQASDPRPSQASGGGGGNGHLLHRSSSQRRPRGALVAASGLPSRRNSTRPASRRCSTLSSDAAAGMMTASSAVPLQPPGTVASSLSERRRRKSSVSAAAAAASAGRRRTGADVAALSQSQLVSSYRGANADSPTHSPARRPSHYARNATGAAAAAATAGPLSSSTRTLHHLQQRPRSAQNSPSPSSSPTGSGGPLSAVAAAARVYKRQLAVDNYLRPGAERMHHLSVENFQQFGAGRPSLAPLAAQQRRQSSNNNNDNHHHHHHGQPSKHRQHSLVFDDGGGLASRLHSMSGGQGGAGEREIYGSMSGVAGGQGGETTTSATSQSLRQRSAANAGGRASFSRIRASIVPGSSAAAVPLLVAAAAAAGGAHATAGNQSLGGGGGGSGVRRMSRDFVRHAGDWSRLSMSANVDLRRLLKLWSHTNPYQAGASDGARPSLGSCSIYSNQANRSPRGYNGAPESPLASGQARRDFGYAAHGHRPSAFAYSASNSPRPSSVNSWQAHEMMAALSRRDQRHLSDVRAFGGALPLDDNLLAALDDSRLEISSRDKCLAYCLSCLDILCIWQCCGAWLRVQRLIALLVFDPFTELFIILCILINTLFMALDSDDADEQMRQVFERGNYFFTATFAVEAAMKIIALSPKFYFREGWNVFDSIIVGLSLLELGLEGVYGLSVLRSFRLLRVFKLAKSWPTLNLLISIMGKAVGDLGNLTFVLAIIVFIFAVMGMQLFGSKYVAAGFPQKELPRWNFTDFMHSFMIVFRILCAEWIEPMWDCLLVAGWPCIPFFLIAVTVGNLVVLNLFLALLLASFGASNLSSPQADNVDTKKLQEAIGRFKRFGRFLRRRAGRLARALLNFVIRRKRPGAPGASGAGGGVTGKTGGLNSGEEENFTGSGSAMKSHIVSMSRMERLQNIERRTEELKSKIRRSPEHHYHLRQLAKSQLRAKPADAQAGGSLYHHAAAYRLAAARRKAAACGMEDEPDSLPMQTIPIIVNEASEGNEEADEVEAAAAAESAREGQPNAYAGNQQWRVIEEIDDMLDADLASLNSEVSLNVGSAEADGQQRPQQQQQQLEAGLQLADRHSVYSTNMQTIREDSRDDSCMSLNSACKVAAAQETDVADEQQQQQPPQQSHEDEEQQQQLVAGPAAAAASGGRASLRHRSISENRLAEGVLLQLNRAGQLDDERVDEEAETAFQLGQPLLPKSRSNPDNLKRPAGGVKPPGQPCQQQVVVATTNAATTTAAVALVEGGQEGDLDEQERPKSSLYLRPPKRQDMEEEDEKTLQHIESYIEKCICIGILCLKWFLFRQYVRKIVEHKLFDQCILILIIISSGTLALEDKHLKDRPTLKRTLDILDTIFTITFSLEMIFKWLAFGMRRYFGNIWSWLDFVIVLVSFVNLMASIFGSGKIQALKTMRTLRAMRGLRPLRALQRFQGMRVVVNALIQAIPSIFNVLLVCLIFWLIFSIMGVQMFGGKFWRCLDPTTRQVVSYEVAANRLECIERNFTWSNPQINFDNVLNAYLALFQVATFKGWIDIMNSASDSRMRDEQPIREANIYMYFYFVFFVIFGSFFTLNLFIGVIIDNFNEQKKKTGGSLEIFMTEDQKKYYHAMKKMRSKRPTRAMTRPKFKPQAYMFDLTTSKRFDLAIMLIIGLNMFVMALEHYGQSSQFNDTLERLNLIFIAIFTLECICKIFAMRHFYFREPWNIFDFIVVDLSILGVVMKEYVAKYFVSPTLLRVVRVVKVGRVLRLVKAAKGIRTLLFALAMSLPALFNICLLLFLVMFIYAIFGMSFFMNVRKRRGLDDIFNFETFLGSIIVLFQMSTSAGWEVVLDPLMDEENDCVKADPSQGIEGTCGNKGIAIAFLVSYVIVTFLIIINMYIAVILENYSQATEDVQEGLTDDDYEMYYEIWQKFDPDGTQYLPYSKLSDFVDSLEPPLRIAKPNELALVVLDINIYEGNQCYCVDILDALTKYFFTRKGLDIQVNEHLQQVQSTLHETPFERITTTYLLKREHYCARVIQNCWRKWRQRAQQAAGGSSSHGGSSRGGSSHGGSHGGSSATSRLHLGPPAATTPPPPPPQTGNKFQDESGETNC